MAKVDFWENTDGALELLITNGYVKLPSLGVFDLESVAESINAEMKGATFAELCPSHKLFLEDLDLDNTLTPKVFEIAKRHLAIRVKSPINIT